MEEISTLARSKIFPLFSKISNTYIAEFIKIKEIFEQCGMSNVKKGAHLGNIL